MPAVFLHRSKQADAMFVALKNQVSTRRSRCIVAKGMVLGASRNIRLIIISVLANDSLITQCLDFLQKLSIDIAAFVKRTLSISFGAR
jgi:hypothetical protein